MTDCLIIGGGVVGLSIAYELSRRGLRVQVLERSAVGTEASWAGAGILPDAALRSEDSSYLQLGGLSHQMHRTWATALREETGINTGYEVCGELHIGDRSEIERVEEEVAEFQAQGLTVEYLDGRALSELEPAYSAAACEQLTACHLPGSAQLRNPWHLQALAAACRKRGVSIIEDAEVVDFETTGDRITAVKTSDNCYSAGAVCLAAGAWNGLVAERLGVSLAVRPVRGQIALLQAPQRNIQRVVHQGMRYLVPRTDGLVLVGSTLEDVGFDKRTTDEAIKMLLEFAHHLVPSLADASLVKSWAGFRPASLDGTPLIGPAPGLSNVFVAAGHYRWGLRLSPATAVLIAELIAGENPSIDLTPFRVDRPMPSPEAFDPLAVAQGPVGASL